MAKIKLHTVVVPLFSARILSRLLRIVGGGIGVVGTRGSIGGTRAPVTRTRSG